MNLYSAGLNSFILDRLYHKIFNLSQAKKNKISEKKNAPLKYPPNFQKKYPASVFLEKLPTYMEKRRLFSILKCYFKKFSIVILLWNAINFLLLIHFKVLALPRNSMDLKKISNHKI